MKIICHGRKMGSYFLKTNIYFWEKNQSEVFGLIELKKNKRKKIKALFYSVPKYCSCGSSIFNITLLITMNKKSSTIFIFLYL